MSTTLDPPYIDVERCFLKRASRLPIDLRSLLFELLRLLGHSMFQGGLFIGDALGGGVVAHILGDLHRAELGAAHRAEVGHFMGIFGQRGVVILARPLWI